MHLGQSRKVIPSRVYHSAVIAYGALVLALSTSSCHKSAPTQPRSETTSHNVVWQLDRFGTGASSLLSDVEIVNDSLAYAVGGIFLNDSSGRLDPIPYNLAKWDGQRWNIQRLTYGGGSPPISFVFAFNDKDIWFGVGYLIHWDGLSYHQIQDPVFDGIRSNRMYGTQSGELYVVGNNGTIEYSPDRGNTWQKLLSGTTLDIKDIFGSLNSLSGSVEIVAVAGNPYVGSDRAILAISGTKVSILDASGVVGALTGVWFTSGEDYWVVGDGMYKKSTLTDPSWSRLPKTLTSDFTEAVKGNASDDVFVVGDFGIVLHYNGATWMDYVAETALNTGAFYSVAVKGNLVIAVGEDPPSAVALVGRRTP